MAEFHRRVSDSFRVGGMQVTSNGSLITQIRHHKTLLLDIVIAFVLIWMLGAGNNVFDVNGPGYAPPWQFLPGFTYVFFLWKLLAFGLLALARTRPAWPCWGIPALLLFHLVFFEITVAATYVTCYIMLLLGRFATPRWRMLAGSTRHLLGHCVSFRGDPFLATAPGCGVCQLGCIGILLAMGCQNAGSRPGIKSIAGPCCAGCYF